MQWTVKEASEFLKVPEDTIHDWIRERGLPATLFNDRYHFNRIKLIDWAHENRVPLHVMNGHGFPPLPLTLQEGGIHRDVPGEDLPSALKEVVGRLPLPKGSNRDLIWRMILAREKEGTTAVGRGIAIPHARHPIILGVERPLLALCFLKTPLGLNAPDGQPVHALFVMVAPNIPAHLHYLERLGHALHDDGFFRLVQARATDEEILNRLWEVEKTVPTADPPKG